MTTIQILGSDDSAFRRLAENAELAARILGIRYRLQRVPDPAALKRFGVKDGPVLAIDGEVKVAGRVPLPEGIMPMLRDSILRNAPLEPPLDLDTPPGVE